MARPSQPLMFLGAFGALWIGARVVVAIWGGGEVARDELRVATKAGEADGAQSRGGMMSAPSAPSKSVVAARQVGSALQWAARRVTQPGWSIVPPDGSHRVAIVPLPPLRSAAGAAVETGPVVMPSSSTAILSVQPAPARADRWTLSGWVFVRPMSAPTTLGQGLLGGSQAGARAAWRLDRDGRAEIYARVVSSGRLGDGVEGAAGVSVQPLRALPVRLSVERRQQLTGSGGRSAFAVLASGGVYEVALPLRFQLDGYAAAGVVGVQRRDLFAEGSTTVRRRLVDVGSVEVDAGAGAWAAVQPDLERVDVGPSVSVRWRIGEVQPRLSVDWRQRAVGDAAPQSGVAVTLAADF